MSIILLLAMLQTILPLLHAHPAGTPTASMGSGLHIHEILDTDAENHDLVPTLHTERNHQIIAIGSVNMPDPLMVADASLLAAFILAILFVATFRHRIVWRELDVHPASTPDFFLFPLRAPPQY